MRQARFSVAVSLDGFIAGPNGELDWMIWSDEAGALAGAHWRDFDTVLVGRRTYEVAVASGQASGDPGGIRSLIFSRTMTTSPPHAELVSEGAIETVRALKRTEGQGIILLGGGMLARDLIANGLVDRIELNVHPVLLGGGAPLFPNGAPTGLQMNESRSLAGGCVLIRYGPLDPA
jgi:dihydrofolate reductase